MPVYEFVCEKCSKRERKKVRYNITRSYSDADKLAQCPFCYTPLKRVYTLLGIQFNGTGFTRSGLK